MALHATTAILFVIQKQNCDADINVVCVLLIPLIIMNSIENKENILSNGIRRTTNTAFGPTALHNVRKFGDPVVVKYINTSESLKREDSGIPVEPSPIENPEVNKTKKLIHPSINLLTEDDDDELPKTPELSCEYLFRNKTRGQTLFSKIQKSQSLSHLNGSSALKNPTPKSRTNFFDAIDQTPDSSFTNNSIQESATYIYNATSDSAKKTLMEPISKSLRHYHSTPEVKSENVTSELNLTSSSQLMNHFMSRRKEFKKPVSAIRFPARPKKDMLHNFDLEDETCSELDDSNANTQPTAAVIGSEKNEKQKSCLTPIIEDESVVKTKLNTVQSKIGAPIEQRAKNEDPQSFGKVSAKTYNSIAVGTPSPQMTSTSVQTEDDGRKVITVNGISYDMLSLLGTGGSSKVYQVFHRPKSRIYAIKQVYLANTEKIIRDGYINEIHLLKRLNGKDRVITLYDYEYDKQKKILNVVIEKGDTDLLTVIRNIGTNGKLELDAIQFYWREMLKAVKVVHEEGIIHSDLKPANFVQVKGNLKLIDFGIASSIQKETTSILKENVIGTYNYMSPEAIKDGCQMPVSNSQDEVYTPMYKINRKTDVWSLGCILYALTYGKTPFQHIPNIASKLHAITNPDFAINYPPANDMLISVIKQCLVRDPKVRASIDELLDINFISNTTVSSPPLICNSNNATRNNLFRKISLLPQDRLAFLNQIADLLKDKNLDQRVLDKFTSST